MTEKAILNSEDIANRVAKKTGIDATKVLHVLKASVGFIKKTVREPDTYAVNIPHVGRLHFNCYSFENIEHIYKRKDGMLSKNFVEQYKDGIDKYHYLKEYQNKLREDGVLHEKSSTKHFRKRLRTSFYFTGENNQESIEKLQNQIYEENIQSKSD